MSFKRPGERLKEIAQAIVSYVKRKPLEAAAIAVLTPLAIFDASAVVTNKLVGEEKIIGLIAGSSCAIAAVGFSARAIADIFSQLSRPREAENASPSLSN